MLEIIFAYFALFLQQRHNAAIRLRVFYLHDGGNFVASIFAGCSAVEELFAFQSVIQEDVAVVEFVFCLVHGEFDIGSHGKKIFLHLFGQRFKTAIVTIDCHGDSLRDLSQQVKRLHADIVVNNRDRFLRHAVNLRVCDIGI